MKDEISAPTFKSGSHFVGPFNYDWHICDFQIDDVMQDSYAFVWWLRTLYQSSTLGLIKDIPPLYNSFSYLEELFYSGDIYKKQTTLSKKRFKDIWSLETSWRKDKSMICDFVFSGLITLNNAGLWNHIHDQPIAIKSIKVLPHVILNRDSLPAVFRLCIK